MSSNIRKMKKSDALEVGSTEMSRVAKVLIESLADTYSLYLKTQNYHWNVEGAKFYAVHNLTETHYLNMQGAIDILAERIRALGFYTPGSYRQFDALSSIKTPVDHPVTDDELIRELSEDHMQLAQRLQCHIELAEEENDQPTADLLTERRSFHEKAAWMFRSICK